MLEVDRGPLHEGEGILVHVDLDAARGETHVPLPGSLAGKRETVPHPAVAGLDEQAQASHLALGGHHLVGEALGGALGDLDGLLLQAFTVIGFGERAGFLLGVHAGGLGHPTRHDGPTVMNFR